MSRCASHKRFPLAKLATYALLLFYLIVVLYPMFWLLTTSLKTDRDIFLEPFKLPRLDELQWKNFSGAWTEGHFGDYFLNSVLVTVFSVGLTLLFASMAAYAVARFSFRGVRPLFFYFLAGLMIPLGLANVTIVSQYRSDWGMAFAGLVVVMLPTLLVYILLQRRITKGLTVGALKG